MFLIPLIILAYIAVALLLIWLVKRFIQKKWLNNVVTVVLILLPFYDIILTKIFGNYYCMTEPNPKTYIKHTVENPSSIYWEDRIYPGYTKEDRELMIMNYLDGVHLQIMALNDANGSIHLYRATKKDWQKTNAITEKGSKYYSIMKEEAQSIIKHGEIYSKSSMPKMDYTITLTDKPLPLFVNRFLYRDEVTITDNTNHEVIGFNQRIMKLFYNIIPDLAGGNYYQSEPICGEQFYIDFEEKVFLKLKYKYGGEVTNRKWLNEILYDRYVRGE